jgi:hypothetical protein
MSAPALCGPDETFAAITTTLYGVSRNSRAITAYLATLSFISLLWGLGLKEPTSRDLVTRLAPDMPCTVRGLTYDLLRELRLSTIFGNPGSSELPFLWDMPSDFRYILGLHERTAEGMALSYSVATGKAAFVNLHSMCPVKYSMLR